MDSDDDGEWIETRNLKVGDEIRLASGNWTKILEIKFKGEGQVYNFTVEGNHNYFVGDLRLLTHNICSQTGLDVLDETGKYSGRNPNFTNPHKLDANDALAAGEDYLGSGYTQLGKADSGVFRSADGLRGFRIDKGSISGSHPPNVPHVHFERYDPSNLRKPVANNHVEIYGY